MSSEASPIMGDLDSLLRTHPQLHHYTNEKGLRGIIESNSLWATYFRHMNDASEIYELRSPLAAELRRRLTPVFEERRRKGVRSIKLPSASAEAEHLARKFPDIMYAKIFSDETSGCYITSFCSHAHDQCYERENGLLSQWRGYGGEGGFCLVLETAAVKIFKQERQSYVYPYTDFREVQYSVDDALKSSLFIDLFQKSEEVLQLALRADRDFSVDAMVDAFLCCATTFKHRGFYEEREVRLIL